MKKILFSAILLFSIATQAQNVAINTTGSAPDASAMLDIVSTAKGLLVPRMTAAQKTAIGTPATGLLIYQTDAGTQGIGFYFYNGTAWVPFSTNNGGWGILGNSGTVGSTNFIGTTDAQDFRIFTSNAERMRVFSNGQVVVNSIAPFASDRFSVYANGNEYGVNGYAAGTGAAVYGQNTGTGLGVYGLSNNGVGTAVQGNNTAAAGAAIGFGGYFSSNQTGGSGLAGSLGSSTYYPGAGVSAYSTSTFGIAAGTTLAAGTAVQGYNTAVAGAAIGFGGSFTSNQTGGSGLAGSLGSNTYYPGAGVSAYSTSTYGIAAGTTLPAGTAVQGYNTAAAGTAIGFGGSFTSNQTGGSGLAGSLGVNQYFAGTGVSGIVVSTLAGGAGVMGSCDNATGYGVRGQSLGSSGIGVQGLSNGNVAGAGVYGTHSAGVAGTGFTNATCRGAVKGEGAVTGSYGFGVIGSGGTSTRSGGVLGDNYNTTRGALGYYSAGAINYGVYAFGNYNLGVAAGRMANSGGGSGIEPNASIGLGVYGGVMGGWIKGLVYGANLSGVKYGAYVHGKTLTNDVIAVLNTGTSNERIPTYASTSMKVEVSAKGTGKLEQGKTTVSFDNQFGSLLSSQEPIIVTVSPLGNSQGLYIENVTSIGFTVVENNKGTSSVNFYWIAIGVKKGFENPQISSEILANDFEEKMNGNSGVMYNDNNPQTPNYSLWWDGTQVRFDKPSLKINREEHTVPVTENKVLKPTQPKTLEPAQPKTLEPAQIKK